MKRRTFLRMLGLAPVAAAVPALALPRPENVKDVVSGEATLGTRDYPFVYETDTGSVHMDVAYPFDVDSINRDLEAHFKDAAAHYRYLVSEAGRLTILAVIVGIASLYENSLKIWGWFHK
ncbi:hypothetical protein OIV19_18995 [Brucella sp. HL-2]|nr:hypothetical protein [Brucella sp. HL-2]MCV9909691.1 hypothetical protein [Brucella sp. HL-2]